MTRKSLENTPKSQESLSYEDFKKEVLEDYSMACISRELSLIGRREVLTGKAKFGIFGGGKELAQIAMAKVFQNGDFRSGYYRDQTFMLASGMATVYHLFSQLYANPSLSADPQSGGRQMNNHFATRNLLADGSWKNLKEQKNSAADSSPTASQMLRALGLALASKKYRNLKDIIGEQEFSDEGREVCFATIGDASTSEGIFWEVVNAAAVQQVPLIINVWDDGYGISVPKKLQTAKESISDVLKGFENSEDYPALKIVKVKGWDYPNLVKTYKEIISDVRENHQPVLVHVEEMIQVQGHSTSGSHERYKSKERLEWEKEFDGIKKMKEWILESKITDEASLKEIETEAKKYVKNEQKRAWNDFYLPIQEEINEIKQVLKKLLQVTQHKEYIQGKLDDIHSLIEPTRRDYLKIAHQVLVETATEQHEERMHLAQWYREKRDVNKERFRSYLHTNSPLTPLNQNVVAVEYSESPKFLSGFQVLNQCFDANFKRDPTILAFGEDVGKIGDVNQAFRGLQEKYGKDRVYDVGIREASIIGEGIGLAMRGLRPIAEIQYLDYLNYAIVPIMDDIASLSYRTKGGQKCPIIIRTRGHRLEGIWHTGSPMSMILGSMRGVHVCVPRNMTQAAGFYNLLLRSDEPALVIECLNGYRIKEKIPSNPGEFIVPLGVPEILRTGKDITLVTYGSSVRIADEASEQLTKVGIEIELIDVQTLLPFDIHHVIKKSVEKTNKVIFLDEDVPSGGTAYMLDRCIKEQGLYHLLDSQPACISAMEHRSAYGSDADYFCKPNSEDVFNKAYSMMHEYNPAKYPLIDL